MHVEHFSKLCKFTEREHFFDHVCDVNFDIFAKEEEKFGEEISEENYQELCQSSRSSQRSETRPSPVTIYFPRSPEQPRYRWMSSSLIAAQEAGIISVLRSAAPCIFHLDLKFPGRRRRQESHLLIQLNPPPQNACSGAIFKAKVGFNLLKRGRFRQFKDGFVLRTRSHHQDA